MIQLEERPAHVEAVQAAPGLPTSHAVPAPSEMFSDAEWAELRRQDKKAGAIIVSIMGAIFTIGVLLYTAIALVALSG